MITVMTITTVAATEITINVCRKKKLYQLIPNICYMPSAVLILHKYYFISSSFNPTR